eukprot:m.218407 g.218407  ORF g.218407 m.218407 type:complete len:2785 (-) comp26259_c1_seq1:68-8422(-)
MSNSSERTYVGLVRPLVDSVALTLPSKSRRADFVVDEELLEHNRQCLISLAQHALGDVVLPLAELLQEVLTAREHTQDEGVAAQELDTSIRLLLNTLNVCFESHWKEKGDAGEMLDPPLSEFIAKQAFAVIKKARPEDMSNPESVPGLAATLVHNLTAKNFNAVFSIVSSRFNALAVLPSDNPDLAEVKMMQFLHYNRERLSQLLQDCFMQCRSMKKGVQVAVATQLCHAIWGWVEKYPIEFMELQQGGQRLSNSCEPLFDLFYELADKPQRKISFWPLLTRLLLLCPDLMLEVHHAEDPSGSPKRKFLEGLKKAVSGSNKQLAEVAIRCHVDICVASTYVSKRTTTSCLRYMAPTIVDELKMKLFNFNKPFFDTIGPDEEQLLISCFVASFRLNSRTVLADLGKPIIEGDVPMQYKIIVIKALLAIKLHALDLEWNPTIDVALPALATPVRQLFQASIKNLTRPINTPSRTSKNKKEIKALNDMLAEVDLLQAIIELFRVVPSFCFHHEPATWDFTPEDSSWADDSSKRLLTDTKKLLTGLTTCLLDDRLSEVSKIAASALLHLHEPEYVQCWNSKDVMSSFWEISCNVIISIAIHLIGSKTSSVEDLLRWLEYVLASRNAFLLSNKHRVREGSCTELHRQTRNKVEVVFLYNLCHPDQNIIRCAANCAKLFCEEADILIDAGSPVDDSFRANLHIYRQLSETGTVVTGFRAQQKRIMSIIRGVEIQTGGNLAAWDGLFSTWSAMADRLTKKIEEGKEVSVPNTELPTEWASFTGFLCAFGGVCLMDDLYDHPSRVGRVPLTTQNIGSQAVPAPLRNADRFISRLIELLVCDIEGVGVQMREVVKESLGQELSPAMYPMLFVHLNEKVKSFFTNKSVSTTPANTLFVDQTIKIVRLLLDSKMEQSHEYLALCDIESLVVGCLDYLRQGTSGEDHQKTKVAFCNMVTLLMSKRHSLTFRHELKFRNSLVEKLMDFVSTSNVTNSNSGALAQQSDLDLSCMKAMAALLEQLPLRVVYDDEADQMEAKSKLFLKYFTFFMNVTNRCRFSPTTQLGSERPSSSIDLRARRGITSLTAQSAAQLDLASPDPKKYMDMLKRGGSEDLLRTPGGLSNRRSGFFTPDKASDRQPNFISSSSSPSPKQPSYHRKRVERLRASVREYSSLAMSNLLSANIDVGLGHSISMGYHEDVGVRGAFTEVLTKVLKQGTEFDTLAETVKSDRYAKLEAMFVHPDLTLIRALSNCIMQSDLLDDLVELVFSMYEAHNAVLPFLARIAVWEVESCSTAQTLFRRNSLASKLATQCTRLYGKAYLRGTLEPIISHMMDAPDVSYEVDPAKLGPEENLEENQKRLQALASQFFEAILNSLGKVPAHLRLVCHAIRSATKPLFPESELSAVGGVMFLRYFTPALVSPQFFGIVHNPLPPRVSRALLLCSKILQAIANKASFTGVKESFMQPLNSFVTASFEPCQEFFNQVSTVPSDIDPTLTHSYESYRVSLGATNTSGSVEPDKSTVDNDNTSAPSPENSPFKSNPPSRASSFSSPTPNRGSKTMLLRAAQGFAAKESDLHALHRLLVAHLEKLGRELASTAGKRAKSSDPSLFDSLSTLLAELGDPPQAESKQQGHSANSTTAKDSKFEEFLARHRMLQTSTEEIRSKNIFFHSPSTKNKRPIFYYIARRYNVVETDPEQLMYHILTTVKPFLNSSFDLVLDLTLFDRESEPALPIMERFASVLPAQMFDQLNSVLVFHPSTYFRAFSKRVERLIFSSKLHRKVRFVAMEELQETIGEPAFPASTFRLLEQTHEFSSNTHRIGTDKKSVPISLRIGPASFTVRWHEKVRVLGITCYLTDVYAISRVAEIQGLADTSLVRISYDRGEPLNIQSSEHEAVLTAAHDAWARHLLSEPTSGTNRKVIRPADVPGTLLNMALLNLGSADPVLRLASYNFLAALTTTFDFHIEGELMEASGLAIPQNNSNFIIRISECLAANEPRLTLEFLAECIAGLENSTREQKHLCLEYMSPWLPNVKEFAAGSPEKTLTIISGLVDVTIREKELYPSLQAKVWYTIGRVPELAEQVVQEFLKVAIESGPSTTSAHVMADACVTLASASRELVSDYILNTMMTLLESTADPPATSIERHAKFRDIEVVTRFLLMLSFNNRLNVEKNFPRVLHIITSLLGSGPAGMRASVHGIIINIMQSLCTALPLSESAVHLVRTRLTDMVQTKFRLQCGISGSKTASSTLVFGSTSSLLEKMMPTEVVHLSTLQVVVDVFREILVACARPEYKWQETLTALTLEAAFHINPALQPRAFVALGVICVRLPSGVFARILEVLRTGLGQLDISLADSILLCLTRLLRTGGVGSFYYAALFWVAVSILQIGEKDLFSSALGLLETALYCLEGQGAFEGQSIGVVLMEARKPIESFCQRLDRKTAITFEKNFGFGMAGALLKGLKHASATVISRTTRVFLSLLNVERQAAKTSLSPTMLGYLAALIPVAEEVRRSLGHESDATISPHREPPPANKRLSRYDQPPEFVLTSRPSFSSLKSAPPPLLSTPLRSASTTNRNIETTPSSSSPSTSSQSSNSHTPHAGETALPYPLVLTISTHEFSRLLNSDVLQKDQDILLLLVTVVASLEDNNHVSSRRVVFQFLAEAAQTFPHVFPLLKTMLFPKLTDVLSRPQDQTISTCCHRILTTLMSNPVTSLNEISFPTNRSDTSEEANTSTNSYLESVGFSGLPTAGTFAHRTKAERQTLTQVCSDMLERVIEMGQTVDKTLNVARQSLDLDTASQDRGSSYA